MCELHSATNMFLAKLVELKWKPDVTIYNIYNVFLQFNCMSRNINPKKAMWSTNKLINDSMTGSFNPISDASIPVFVYQILILMAQSLPFALLSFPYTLSTAQQPDGLSARLGRFESRCNGGSDLKWTCPLLAHYRYGNLLVITDYEWLSVVITGKGP